jgi:hypothetical protein
MARVSLEKVLHRAPIVIINGYEIDEDSWRFHPNGIRCAGPDDDPVWAFKDQQVDVRDNGTCDAIDSEGQVVYICLRKTVPFTAKDLP